MKMRLNCDLGESFGAWTMGLDTAVMPHIDLANIACGFHAGDPVVMKQTLKLAKANGVTVGAHPGYHDLAGFGRRSMSCSFDEVVAMVQYQVAALEGLAHTEGLELAYVKPHGAMYNDMMAKPEVRAAIMQAIAEYHRPLVLMLQATPDMDQHRAEAAAAGIQVWFEVFADRCYADDGKLLARSKPGAVHNREKMLKQVKQLCDEGTVTTVSGHVIDLQADTLCVHGDNIEAVQAIEALRELIG
ncbi:MAG: 5-oxoprolinase subunit PxpA [Pseudomonadales bacterium]